MKITRHEEFEMAHVLDGYNGGCGNLHGHSYKIEVTLEGYQDKDNFDMVMDFKELKEIIKEIVPDHMFAVNNTKTEGYEYELWQLNKKYSKATIEFPFVTTAENMVGWFAQKIQAELVKRYGQIKSPRVVEVNLWETTNSHTTWIEGGRN